MLGVYNMRVVNDLRGEGLIKDWQGGILTVRFGTKDVHFWFPMAFENGALRTTDPGDQLRIDELASRWFASVIDRFVTESEGFNDTEENRNVAYSNIRTMLGKSYSDEQIVESFLKEKARRHAEANIDAAAADPVRISEAAAHDAAAPARPNNAAPAAKQGRVQPAPAPQVGGQPAPKGESKFTGGAFANFGVPFVEGLVTVVSLGIAFPWIHCWARRWEREHTYIDGRQLTFTGRGGELFVQYIKWWLLSIVTLGIYGIFFLPRNVQRWETEHTHGVGINAPSRFDGTVGGMFKTNILTRLVVFITFGFAGNWAVCYRERYYANHTTFDGLPLRFEGTAKKYARWARKGSFKRLFLTIITLGIYGLKTAVLQKDWLIKQTHFGR